LAERERAVYDAIAADAPLRGPEGDLPPEDALVVRLLAEALIRRERVGSYLTAYGTHREDTGEVRPAVDLERRLRLEAFTYAESMGLTPRSRASLGLSLVRTAEVAERIEVPDDDEWHRGVAALLERQGAIEGTATEGGDATEGEAGDGHNGCHPHGPDPEPDEPDVEVREVARRGPLRALESRPPAPGSGADERRRRQRQQAELEAGQRKAEAKRSGARFVGPGTWKDNRTEER
jgi:hypothetical protein